LAARLRRFCSEPVFKLDRHWPGVSITGPAWIGHGSHLRAGAQVVRSVLFEYTRIPADMRFFEMIMSPDYCVDRYGETLYRGDDTARLRWGNARA